MHKYVCAHQCSSTKRPELSFPLTWRDSCESPDMDAGNQMQVLSPTCENTSLAPSCVCFLSLKELFFFFLKDLRRKITKASCQGKLIIACFFCWCTQAASPKGRVQEVSRGHKKEYFYRLAVGSFQKKIFVMQNWVGYRSSI